MEMQKFRPPAHLQPVLREMVADVLLGAKSHFRASRCVLSGSAHITATLYDSHCIRMVL